MPGLYQMDSDKCQLTSRDIHTSDSPTGSGGGMAKRGLQGLCGASDLAGDQLLWKQLLAEFLGTGFLVLIACGSCVHQGAVDASPSTVQIALTFGLVVATIAQSIGHVSGGHINPAVTAGMVTAGAMTPIKGAFYVCAQSIGALCGAAVLHAVVPTELHSGLGNTGFPSSVQPLQAFFIEALITFVLVLVVFAATDSNRLDVQGSIPLAIGLSITACHLFAVPLTGSSMNPARSFGPALITQSWDYHYIYWAGPILGGVAAGALYKFVFQAAKPSVDDLEKAARMCCLAKLSGKEAENGVTSF